VESSEGEIWRRARARTLTTPTALCAHPPITTDEEHGQAVKYRVKFVTAYGRGAGASTQDAGVQTCLLAEDGRAFMFRVEPYTEQLETGWVKRRFEDGAVDEVVVDAPDLGENIAAVWVAPEEGTWCLQEVDVQRVDAEGKGGKMQRFACGALLGEPPARDTAVELRPTATASTSTDTSTPTFTPAPSNANFTDEEREVLARLGVEEYRRRRRKAALIDAALVGSGAGVLAFAVPSLAPAYAFGGAVGATYLALLGLGVDAIGDEGMGPISRVRRVLGAPPVRLALVGAATVLAVTYGDDEMSQTLARLAAGAGGFFCYKLAVIVAV